MCGGDRGTVPSYNSLSSSLDNGERSYSARRISRPSYRAPGCGRPRNARLSPAAVATSCSRIDALLQWCGNDIEAIRLADSSEPLRTHSSNNWIVCILARFDWTRVSNYPCSLDLNKECFEWYYSVRSTAEGKSCSVAVDLEFMKFELGEGITRPPESNAVSTTIAKRTPKYILSLKHVASAPGSRKVNCQSCATSHQTTARCSCTWRGRHIKH